VEVEPEPEPDPASSGGIPADGLSAAQEQVLAEAEPDELVDGDVRDLVAGVDDDNPFGRPGRPVGQGSALRLGFFITSGGLLALALGAAVLAVRQVLVLIVISGFLAIGLDPAVTWLERRMRRGAAVGLVIVAFFGFFGGFVAAVVPPVTSQVTELMDRGPQYVDDLARNRTVQDLDSRFHFLEAARRKAAELPNAGVSAMGGVLGAGQAVLGLLASVVTVLTLTVYFLANLPGLKRSAYLAVPRTRRARVSLLSDEILARVGGYVLGNLATSVVAGLATLIFLWVTGVPYGVALALIVAVTDLIPLVGATIGAAVVTLVAFAGAGVTVGIAAIVFFIIYQQFENFVLVPRVMKRTVDVSPLATIVAALIGAALLGVVGALLAIPVAAAIHLISREVLLPRQDDI
jgi:predicted PurR-regulated permease PerM